MLPPLKTSAAARAGEWDRAGNCFPGPHTTGMQSFTIGLFQWAPRRGGGLKRGPVQERMKGYPSTRERTLAEANQLVALRNRADRPAEIDAS